MLNDFHSMVLAVVASQGAIAVLLTVMAKLEPAKTSDTGPQQVARDTGEAREAAGDLPPVPPSRLHALQPSPSALAVYRR